MYPSSQALLAQVSFSQLQAAGCCSTGVVDAGVVDAPEATAAGANSNRKGVAQDLSILILFIMIAEFEYYTRV